MSPVGLGTLEGEVPTARMRRVRARPHVRDAKASLGVPPNPPQTPGPGLPPATVPARAAYRVGMSHPALRAYDGVNVEARFSKSVPRSAQHDLTVARVDVSPQIIEPVRFACLHNLRAGRGIRRLDCW